MKYGIAIFLSMVLLAQSMHPLVRQMAKVPNLIQHYLTHNAHGHRHDLHILSFLTHHYSSHGQHRDTDNTHAGLPFSCADTTIPAISPAIPAALPDLGVWYKLLFQQQAPRGSRALYSILLVQDIFRPPLG
ncbi:MAG: hypothetical protein EP344_08490 [Bacteroidetes bacterium]|nr:MAG: hypothetical protein EP344_08490 [Bacteroidota bacterium]